MKRLTAALIFCAGLALPQAEAAQYTTQSGFDAALAAAGLQGQGGVPGVLQWQFSDDFRTWGTNYNPTFSGSQLVSGRDSRGLDQFGVSMNCYQPIFPCSGGNTVTVVFDRPIQAMSGQLSYFTLSGRFLTGGFDLFDNALIEASAPLGSPRYDGFWGIIFDAPITTLTINSLTPQSDNGNGFRLTIVPEPGTLALLLAGVAGLGLARWARRG